MAKQLSLFDAPAPARARQSDPVTSHTAAGEANSSTWLAAQAAEVLDCVKRHPGSTSAEIGELLGWKGARWAAARRLPEMERRGVVKRGEARRCEASGRTAVTWWVK